MEWKEAGVNKLVMLLSSVFTMVAVYGQTLAETALIEIRLPEPRIGMIYVGSDGGVVGMELDDEEKTQVPVIDMSELQGVTLKEVLPVPVDVAVWEDLASGAIFYCSRWWLTWCWGMEMEEAFEGALTIHVDEKGRVSKVVDPSGTESPNRFFNFAEEDVENVRLVSLHTYRLVEYSKDGQDMRGVIDLAVR